MYTESTFLVLIASQLEGDTDYPMVDHLYEKCNLVISTLRTAQPNPYISTSLENLLETLSFQKSTLDSHHHGPSQDRRPFKYSDYVKKAHGDCFQQNADKGYRETNHRLTIQDMLLPCNIGDGSLQDVAGLDEAKQIIKEAVIMPIQYPQLFQGGAKPWTRLLLYGPPGTGKTKLARTLASELRCPFYCVSSANLLSSWIGESEKLIRDLFQHARQQCSQSIIFIDEIDSLCRKRSLTEDEHIRRVKSELLRQIEGVEDDKDSSVFLLGATNCPWDLDSAFLRRFQRRLLIPLPNREGRRAIISSQFSSLPLQMTDSDWTNLLNATEGYSGADLMHLTMAAAFQPIRDLQSSRFWRFTDDNKITPCSSDTLGAMQYPLSKLPAHRIVARNVEPRDFLMAIQTTPRTVSPSIIQQYEQFSSAVHQT
ncbi:suppressor protein of bem1/bed5 double mutants-like isoform X2 [Homarus americanus]|uniref:suppressor protein of bem1/bed5 double mutants-like isoform X2 n=1 Tax=Homarus americanus TaxID=6706 RepID=UPI001C46CE14|nr:suppressor protein of bem1/bed5 double mutants-like isoform X2 [Homarus americanus]